MKLFIKNLTLDNFKCITHSFLDFSDEKNVLNFIQGENGYGKSTVLEALALCLDDFKKGKTYADYINWDADKKESAKIELNAIINENELKIFVEIPQNSPLVRTAEYKGEVKKGIEVLGLLEDLGIKDFSKIMFYLQGAPDITNTPPAELSDILQKLFDYDLTEYLEKLDTTSLNETLKNLEIDLASRKNAEFKPLDPKPQELTKEEYEALSENLDKIKKDLVELNTEVTKISETTQKKSGEQETLRTLEQAIFKDKEQKTNLEFFQENYDKILLEKNQAKDVLDEEISKKQALETSLDPIKNECIELENKHKVRKAQIEVLEIIETLQPLKEKIVSTQDINEKLSYELDQYKEAIRILKAEAQGVCPTCNQKLGDCKDLNIDPAIMELKQLGLEKLQQDFTTREAQVLKNTQDVAVDKSEELRLTNNYSYLINQFGELLLTDKEQAKTLIEKEAIETIENQMNEAFTKLEDVKRDLLLVTSKVNDLQIRHDQIIVPLKDPNALTLEQIETNLANNESLKANTLKAIEIVDLELGNFKSMEVIANQKNQLLMEEAGLTNQREDYIRVLNYNKEIEEKNKEIKESEKQNNLKIEQIALDIENVSAQITDFTTAKTLIGKNLPSYITVKTCEKLEIEINKFLNVVFPDMVVEMQQERKGVSFFYSFNSTGKRATIKMASGFEKQLLSLSFKVALSKAYGLSSLFLDEVDSFSSQENSRKLYEALLTTGMFDQIFLISHNGSLYDDLKQDFDVALFKTIKKGQIERVY